MAASFFVTDSYRDVQVRSQTDVRDVQVVAFITQPSGVNAQRAIPHAQWITGGGLGAIDQTAQAIEGLISGGLAVAAQGVEDTDAFGLSVFLIEFVVEAPAPNPAADVLTTTVMIPVDTLTYDISFASFIPGATPQQALQQAYQQLVDTGAL